LRTELGPNLEAETDPDLDPDLEVVAPDPDPYSVVGALNPMDVKVEAILLEMSLAPAPSLQPGKLFTTAFAQSHDLGATALVVSRVKIVTYPHVDATTRIEAATTTTMHRKAAGTVAERRRGIAAATQSRRRIWKFSAKSYELSLIPPRTQMRTLTHPESLHHLLGQQDIRLADRQLA